MRYYKLTTQNPAIKLAPQINRLVSMIQTHPNTPETWKKNARAFLTKLATEEDSIKVWDYTIKAMRRFWGRVNQPFGWIRTVMFNPLFEETERFEKNVAKFQAWDKEQDSGSRDTQNINNSASLNVPSPSNEGGKIGGEGEGLFMPRYPQRQNNMY